MKRERGAAKRDEENRVKKNKKCRRRRCRTQKGCMCLSEKKSEVPQGISVKEEVSTDSHKEEKLTVSLNRICDLLHQSPHKRSYSLKNRLVCRGTSSSPFP